MSLCLQSTKSYHFALQIVRVPRLNLHKCQISYTKVAICKSTSKGRQELVDKSAEFQNLQERQKSAEISKCQAAPNIKVSSYIESKLCQHGYLSATTDQRQDMSSLPYIY